jgi:hypothetical protein
MTRAAIAVIALICAAGCSRPVEHLGSWNIIYDSRPTLDLHGSNAEERFILTLEGPVHGVTFANPRPNKHFSILWIQDSVGHHPVRLGSSVLNETCAVNETPGSATLQNFIVTADFKIAAFECESSK